MLTACWSVKGGSGLSVVAAALAVLRRRGDGALLVDLDGDQPGILGCAEPAAPGGGITGGFAVAVADDVATAIRSAEIDVADGLALLPRGPGPLPAAGRATAFVEHLARERRAVIVDCGRPGADDGLAAAVVGSADRSLLVVRPCFLALRRATTAPWRPDGVVLVTEVGRALGARDVEGVLGAPVVAVVEVDPAVARVVDAGLLLSRPPRILSGPLADVA